ncbi:MAG TPA: hypothetical protein VL126_02925, partial [Bacteroidota bacterium]|nr:hypothetical protein [Bacteroidota bacterium]
MFLSAVLVGNIRGQETPPILEYPQQDLDDTAAYQGYQTRFYRDADGNAVQVVLNHLNGRLVNLCADGADESMSFTARDSSGRAATLSWLSAGATPSRRGNRRFLQYDLSSESPRLELGLFLLASMRKERDFQYMHKGLLPFDSAPFIEDPLPHLVENLGRLSVAELDRQLLLLHAPSVEALRARFIPRITLSAVSGRWLLTFAQRSFDARNLLTLELSGDTAASAAEITGPSVSIRSRNGRPVELRICIGTDSPALTPLRRDKIFNDEFLRFVRKIDDARDSTARPAVGSADSILQRRSMLRSERLERQMRSIELLSYREKLMAGLPNYATYFGRDMMMSALMMESILRPSVCAYVIESVLKKLSPEGRVSHEEALGGQ